VMVTESWSMGCTLSFGDLLLQSISTAGMMFNCADAMLEPHKTKNKSSATSRQPACLPAMTFGFVYISSM